MQRAHCKRECCHELIFLNLQPLLGQHCRTLEFVACASVVGFMGCLCLTKTAHISRHLVCGTGFGDKTLVTHSAAICDSVAATPPTALYPAEGSTDLRYPPLCAPHVCCKRQRHICAIWGHLEGIAQYLAMSEKHRCCRYSCTL